MTQQTSAAPSAAAREPEGAGKMQYEGHSEKQPCGRKGEGAHDPHHYHHHLTVRVL